MTEYCAACYGAKVMCRKCKTTHCSCSWNRCPPTRKQYRELLNKQDKGQVQHRHNRYQQRTREYGDYLYFQDREKFEFDYREHLKGLKEE